MKTNATYVSELDTGLRNFFLGVFNNMAAGLAVTAAVSLAVSTSPALMTLLFGGAQAWLVILAPLAMVFWISFTINSMTTGAARAWFYAYAAVMGLSLSLLVAAYTTASLVNAFASTAAMFGAMSLYGYTTQRDLTGMGGFLFMGLIGLIIASIVNIWLASSALTFAVSVITVIVFAGLTAWDVQRLKQQYDNLDAAQRDRAGVLGALSLYINFINIFISLLQLFGNRE